MSQFCILSLGVAQEKHYWMLVLDKLNARALEMSVHHKFWLGTNLQSRRWLIDQRLGVYRVFVFKV